MARGNRRVSCKSYLSVEFNHTEEAEMRELTTFDDLCSLHSENKRAEK